MRTSKLVKQFESLSNRVDCDDLARAKKETLESLKTMCNDIIAAVDAEMMYRTEHNHAVAYFPLLHNHAVMP